MHALSLSQDVLLFLAGVATGGVNSVAGGGMLIGFPVLVAAGLPLIVANATGKIVVFPGQVASAIGYRSFWRDTPKRYFLLIIPAVLGGALGAFLLRHTTTAQFAFIAPYLILAAVILFALEPRLSTLLHHGRRFAAPLGLLSLGMLAVSVYAGYFGIGFGFMVLSLLSFGGMESIHHMNVIKNLSVSVMLLVIVAILAPGSFIDWPAGLVMAAGATIGGYAAARFAPKVPTAALRTLIIVFGLLSVLYFLAFHPL